jgi:uncharacterized protein YjiS (DUF1127 family)
MGPMNALTNNDQFTFSLGNASYIDHSYSEYDEPSAPAVKAPEHRFGQWLRRAVAAFTAWRHRQVVLQEMQMMTDRELADIGLTRSDLARVFDPVFAADRVRGSDYIAY